MQYSRQDDGFERVATIDIETTHYKPRKGETVSIGIGVHDRGTPASEATYDMFHRSGDGEAALIGQAIEHLNGLGADGLVSYKGRTFDLDFLYKRLQFLEEAVGGVDLATPETHVDLFEPRKEEAERQNSKWPKLEECLDSYECTPATTVWGDAELTNVRFGEELGPAFLQTLDAGDDERRAALVDVIEHYLVTDLEANIAIYYGDIGETFEPTHLGTTKTFDA